MKFNIQIALYIEYILNRYEFLVQSVPLRINIANTTNLFVKPLYGTNLFKTNIVTSKLVKKWRKSYVSENLLGVLYISLPLSLYIYTRKHFRNILSPPPPPTTFS